MSCCHPIPQVRRSVTSILKPCRISSLEAYFCVEITIRWFACEVCSRALSNLPQHATTKQQLWHCNAETVWTSRILVGKMLAFPCMVGMRPYCFFFCFMIGFWNLPFENITSDSYFPIFCCYRRPDINIVNDIYDRNLSQTSLRYFH